MCWCLNSSHRSSFSSRMTSLCVLMPERTGDIEASVQDDQLRLGLLLTLAHAGLLLLVCGQSAQEYFCQVLVHPTLRSVSYRGELSQGAAESGQLFSHPIQDPAPVRGVGQGHVGLQLQAVNLALVRREGDVDLHQGLHSLPCCRLGESLEEMIRYDFSEIDMGCLVLSHSLAEVLHQELDAFL